MEYTVGSLADFISGSNTPNKLKVTKQITSVESKSNVTQKLNVKVPKDKTFKKKGSIKSKESVNTGRIQKLKEKSHKIGKESVLKTIASEENGVGTKKSKSATLNKTLASNVQKDNKSKSKTEKAPKPPKELSKEEIAESKLRTIFVGNIPHESNKKDLKQLFRKYGDIESVRLRCAALRDPRTPKKVAIIKREFHQDRTSINAFVVFRTKEAAQAALAANGTLVGEHHIRVDLAESDTQTKDQKLAIFVGNMPFSTEEEVLWKLFGECGDIASVRIVRDKKTGMGKGFGYVNFKTIDGVELALKLEGIKIGQRELRITRSLNKDKVGTNTAATNKPQKSDNKRNPDGSKKRKRSVEQPKKATKEDVAVDDSAITASAEKKTKTESVAKKPEKIEYAGAIAEKKKSTKNKVNKGELKKKKMIKRLAPHAKPPTAKKM